MSAVCLVTHMPWTACTGLLLATTVLFSFTFFVKVVLVRQPDLRVHVHRACVHRFKYHRVGAVLEFDFQSQVVFHNNFKHVCRHTNRGQLGTPMTTSAACATPDMASEAANAAPATWFREGFILKSLMQLSAVDCIFGFAAFSGAVKPQSRRAFLGNSPSHTWAAP